MSIATEAPPETTGCWGLLSDDLRIGHQSRFLDDLLYSTNRCFCTILQPRHTGDSYDSHYHYFALLIGRCSHPYIRGWFDKAY